MTKYLKVDKRASTNIGHYYGHAGDEVELVGEHGGLFIVEHPKSGRFFAKPDELSDVALPSKKEEPQAIEKPDSGPTNKKAQPKKKAVPIINEQQNLF